MNELQPNARSAGQMTVALAIFAALAFGASRAESAEAKRPPNVLLIVADDMGFSDLGCYGGEIRTPNLDRLAGEGVRFSQFYNTARCWPTRGAILTGYYAQHIRRDSVPGVQGGGQGKRPAWAKLLPAMLRPYGYRNYHSGKWHIDGRAMAQGFDRSYELDDHNRLFSPKDHLRDGKPLPAVDRNAGYYATTAIADFAIETLQDHEKHFAERPFFCFVAFTVPHFPLQAPAEDVERYRNVYASGWDAMREARWERLEKLGLIQGVLSPTERSLGPPHGGDGVLAKIDPAEVNRPVVWSDLTDDQKAFQATKMAIHAAMVDRMDQEIGRVLNQVKQMGAEEDTLVVFLSDNGASAELLVRGDGHDRTAAPGSAETFLCLGPGWSTMCNTPMRRHKTWVHEGGIATPLVVRWPKGIAARGEWRDNPGHVVDFVPTILEAIEKSGANRAKTETEQQPDESPAGENEAAPPGKSLLPVLVANKRVERESIWWMHEGHRAIRMGDWKLVAARGEPWELYNLSVDRTETNDLAAKMPEQAKRLADAWKRQWKEIQELAKRDL